ncbi:VOC family protein [Streptomyces sp. HNM0574]|uniref:VOC family protein n=1 Tax=Streptomyces sp. HNM0574 TaxID=2714954 RepID=UPI00146BF4B6|nr:VOC family protein [Streptomyces sp. HNM0574]NLU69329.1 VOC family protein [Streptomyces sp. HNM0574]
MQKIRTNMWFDDQAEEAIAFYLSVFGDGRVHHVLRNTESSPGGTGTVVAVEFELAGQQFVAINGGPYTTFNDAMSLEVPCDTQDEVDHYWNRLTEGGEEVQCGWLHDRYGVSWQIVPRRLHELLRDPDREAADRVMKAMLGMKKLDIRALEDAYGK